MDSRGFLLVLGMDPKKWAARFGIEPFTTPCDACGEALTTSIPFFFETLRGLVAPDCSCGNKNTPYCLVRAYGDGDLFAGR